jgi:hypothetical protein
MAGRAPCPTSRSLPEEPLDDLDQHSLAAGCDERAFGAGLLAALGIADLRAALTITSGSSDIVSWP